MPIFFEKIFCYLSNRKIDNRIAMKHNLLAIMAFAVVFSGFATSAQAQSFEEFVKQQNQEFEDFAKERQQGIEALKAEYEQTVEDYKRAMNRMYDSEISSIELMKSDDNIEVTSKAKAPKSTVSSSELSKDAKEAKKQIDNASSDEILKKLTGANIDEANQQQVKEATNKLAIVISDVINQTEPAKAEPAQEPAKAEPKQEQKTESEQKSEPKKEAESKTGNSNIPRGNPCKYNRISSPFGERIHPVYGRKSFHKGVDLASPNGTPIYATADGIVAFAGVCNGYGNFIKLNHQNGYKTGYAHMSRMVVSSGAKVKKGDLIGYVGSTGTSTGNHLHYEVYYNDQLTDPAKTL